MIYAVVSNKGGAGKSTIAFNVLTAVLDNFVLVEIDDNNDTSQVYSNSQTLIIVTGKQIGRAHV